MTRKLHAILGEIAGDLAPPPAHAVSLEDRLALAEIDLGTDRLTPEAALALARDCLADRDYQLEWYLSSYNVNLEESRENEKKAGERLKTLAALCNRLDELRRRLLLNEEMAEVRDQIEQLTDAYSPMLAGTEKQRRRLDELLAHDNITHPRRLKQ